MSFASGRNTVLIRENQGVDRPPAIPNAMDDEFDGNTLNPKWLWLDQGATTARVANGTLELRLAEAQNRMRGIYQPAPAGAWQFRAKVGYGPQQPSTQGDCGLFLGQSLTQDIRSISYHSSTLYALQRGTPATAASQWGSGLTVGVFMNWVYMRLEYNGAGQMNGFVSFDGYNWLNYGPAAVAYTPAIIGLCIGTNVTGSHPGGAYFEWFRRYL